MSKKKYYTTKKFKKLQKKYYDMLKEEGFRDIENGMPNTPFLYNHSLEEQQRGISNFTFGKEFFYRTISQWYWENIDNWTKPKGEIFRLVCEGDSFTEIQRKIKINRKTIAILFKESLKEMKKSDWYLETYDECVNLYTCQPNYDLTELLYGKEE